MAPAHPAQETPDVVTVIADPELALDHLGDAGGRPEVGAVARGNRSLQEGLLQGAPLLLGELGRPARGGLNLESILSTGLTRISTPHHARGGAVDQLGNFIQGSALVEQLEGSASAVFQYLCRPLDSHNRHHLLVSIIALLMQMSIIDLTKSSGYHAGYWEHVDLFALREADDDNLKDALGITLINSGIENIRYESQHFVIKTLNEFANRQLSVSSELIDDLRPEVIVVVNATASHLLREKLKDRLKYNRRRRFHLLDVDGKSRGTPILFSGMITRGALDVYSRGRLLNDMERAREYVTRR